MRSWLRKSLFRFVLWLTNKFSSKPERERVYRQLTELYDCIIEGKVKKGIVIPFSENNKFIIFSDQHKGSRNGADDFVLSEPNYITALDYYYQQNFALIALGDCEELWENTITGIRKNQQPSFDKEKMFADANRFFKIFGNHDLFWANDPFAAFQLKAIYGYEIPVYEGLILQTEFKEQQLNIFCTHGHQGDKVSDGNWFSKFFVSRIWAPLQAFTKINPNTPAYDAQLKSLHNSMMYEWSRDQKNLLLITGHTHQPVFQSLTYLERLYRKLLLARQEKNAEEAKKIEEQIQILKFQYENISGDYLTHKPTYFNTGCCCFNDGDITGIEIENNCIRLVKWEMKTNVSQRHVLEEAHLQNLLHS